MNKTKFFNKVGYTLIELLAVMIVLMTIGGIITSVLVSALRSGNRSTTTNSVRQTGSYALSQMTKMLTFAQGFDNVSLNGVSSTNCVVPDVPAGSPTPAPFTYDSIEITSFDGGQTTFSCPLNQTYNTHILSSNSAYLTDPNAVDATCSFTCSQESVTTPPTIGITLNVKSKGTSSFIENQTQVNFQTSVTFRNKPVD